MNTKVKEYILAHPKVIRRVLTIFNVLNPYNRVYRGKTNSIELGACFLHRSKIKIEGKGNRIVLEDFTQLRNTTIYIHGNNNVIHLSERCYMNEADFYIEDNNGQIIIGKHTSVDGKTQFAVIEGKSINIGNDCMFSSGINVRTGDSHSILDINKNRINPSKDVSIGDHCWIGMHSIILKGSTLHTGTIVGAGSIVSKEINCGNCIIAGVPAKVIKENVDWSRIRI